MDRELIQNGELPKQFFCNCLIHRKHVNLLCFTFTGDK